MDDDKTIDLSSSGPDLDMDRIFEVLGNPVRRKILEYLAREKHYPLQLSRELGISQQAIMKHLKVLEDAGLVESFTESSPGRGPDRKYYRIRKGFKLDITLTKNMFRINYSPMDESTGEIDVMGERKLEDIIHNIEAEKDPYNKLNLIYLAIEQIDHILDENNQRMEKLLHIRDRLLEEAHSLILYLFRDYDERILLYYIIERHGARIEEMAEDINFREKVIQDILKEIKDLDFI